MENVFDAVAVALLLAVIGMAVVLSLAYGAPAPAVLAIGGALLLGCVVWLVSRRLPERRQPR